MLLYHLTTLAGLASSLAGAAPISQETLALRARLAQQTEADENAKEQFRTTYKARKDALRSANSYIDSLLPPTKKLDMTRFEGLLEGVLAAEEEYQQARRRGGRFVEFRDLNSPNYQEGETLSLLLRLNREYRNAQEPLLPTNKLKLRLSNMLFDHDVERYAARRDDRVGQLKSTLSWWAPRQQELRGLVAAGETREGPSDEREFSVYSAISSLLAVYDHLAEILAARSLSVADYEETHDGPGRVEERLRVLARANQALVDIMLYGGLERAAYVSAHTALASRLQDSRDLEARVRFPAREKTPEEINALDEVRRRAAQKAMEDRDSRLYWVATELATVPGDPGSHEIGPVLDKFIAEAEYAQQMFEDSAWALGLSHVDWDAAHRDSATLAAVSSVWRRLTDLAPPEWQAADRYRQLAREAEAAADARQEAEEAAGTASPTTTRDSSHAKPVSLEEVAHILEHAADPEGALDAELDSLPKPEAT